jgi:hypothetical protein
MKTNVWKKEINGTTAMHFIFRLTLAESIKIL